MTHVLCLSLCPQKSARHFFSCLSIISLKGPRNCLFAVTHPAAKNVLGCYNVTRHFWVNDMMADYNSPSCSDRSNFLTLLNASARPFGLFVSSNIIRSVPRILVDKERVLHWKTAMKTSFAKFLLVIKFDVAAIITIT